MTNNFRKGLGQGQRINVKVNMLRSSSKELLFELFFTLKSLIIGISDKVSAYGDFFPSTALSRSRSKQAVCAIFSVNVLRMYKIDIYS